MANPTSDLEALYRRRHAVFVRTLAGVLGDIEAAADAVQEGFARALTRIDQFRGEGSLEGWVWQICLNQARKAKRVTSTLALEQADAVVIPPLEFDPDLHDAVRMLPPKRRLVVFLRYFADLSYDEIAYVTGMRLGTVSATLNKAHEELATQLTLQEFHS